MKKIKIKSVFFNKSKKCNFTFEYLGRSHVVRIQTAGCYCGGYTTRLIVSLTSDPKADIKQQGIWQCSSENDNNLRNEDADKVRKHNPSESHKYAVNTVGNEHKGSQVSLEKDREQKIETESVLLKIQNAVNKLDNNIIDEVNTLIKNSNLDLEFGDNVKKILIDIYENFKNKLSEDNLLFYFFNEKTKQSKNIDSNSEVNNQILIIDLWKEFVKSIKNRLSKVERKEISSPESLNEWNENLFKYFLKLMVISHNKAHKIDCLFKNVSADEIKKLLLETRDKILKKEPGEEFGVLIFREFNNKPTIFRLYIEDKKNKRVCLEIFSDIFSEDIQNNVRKKKWEKTSIFSIKELKSNYPKTLISSDFLKPENQSEKYNMTRLSCYSIPPNVKYLKTLLLYKCFQVIGAEIKENSKIETLEENILEKLHKKYISNAQHNFIKDASVSKAQQGFSYQEHLIMLFAFLAKDDAPSKNFSLIAEAMVPEAWNDVVLEWNGDLIFFQQKHRSSYSTSVKECYFKK